jgi:uncharacterized protein (TIRG00374 family)
VKLKRVIISFSVITIIYLMLLIWLDSRNEVFTELPRLISLLPTMMGLSFVSYVIRYLRWYWLLSRAGSKTKVFHGFLSYIAGFAFTATPGKLGELVRIRYLTRQGVPPWKVLAAFIYERAFDLVAVLLLSTLAISQNDIFLFVSLFVVVILLLLVSLVFNSAWLTRISAFLRFYKFTKLSRINITLRNGLNGCRVWLTLLDALVSLMLGMLAWSVASFSFVLLVNGLDLSIPDISAFAIYPLAMLAGAVSMLPGGFGSTEATVVILLTQFSVPIANATLAAIGIRLSSMWFAILIGFLALCVNEFYFYKFDNKQCLS